MSTITEVACLMDAEWDAESRVTVPGAHDLIRQTLHELNAAVTKAEDSTPYNTSPPGRTVPAPRQRSVLSPWDDCSQYIADAIRGLQ